MLDLGDIRQKVDVVRKEVHFLTESHMLAIPPVMPLFVQQTPSPEPKYFELFGKDDG